MNNKTLRIVMSIVVVVITLNIITGVIRLAGEQYFTPETILAEVKNQYGENVEFYNDGMMVNMNVYLNTGSNEFSVSEYTTLRNLYSKLGKKKVDGNKDNLLITLTFLNSRGKTILSSTVLGKDVINVDWGNITDIEELVDKACIVTYN